MKILSTILATAVCLPLAAQAATVDIMLSGDTEFVAWFDAANPTFAESDEVSLTARLDVDAEAVIADPVIGGSIGSIPTLVTRYVYELTDTVLEIGGQVFTATSSSVAVSNRTTETVGGGTSSQYVSILMNGPDFSFDFDTLVTQRTNDSSQLPVDLNAALSALNPSSPDFDPLFPFGFIYMEPELVNVTADDCMISQSNLTRCDAVLEFTSGSITGLSNSPVIDPSSPVVSTPSAVPLPASLGFALFGLVALGVARRRA